MQHAKHGISCVLVVLLFIHLIAAPAVPVVITLISELANGNEVENDVMTKRDESGKLILYVNKK